MTRTCLLLALCACSGEFRTHTLVVEFDDAGERTKLKIRAPSVVDGQGASWPAPDLADGTDQMEIPDFPFLRMGAIPVRFATLTLDGSAHGAAPDELVVITERIRLGNRDFPLIQEGRLEGQLGDLKNLDGRFTIGGESCNDANGFSDNLQCGGLWPIALAEVDPLEIGDLQLAHDCPKAVIDAFVPRGAGTMSRKELRFGEGQALRCLDTGRGDTGQSALAGEDVELGPILCHGFAEVAAEGCSWGVSALGRPDLPLTLSASTLDDCAPARCDALAISWTVEGLDGTLGTGPTTPPSTTSADN